VRSQNENRIADVARRRRLEAAGARELGAKRMVQMVAIGMVVRRCPTNRFEFRLHDLSSRPRAAGGSRALRRFPLVTSCVWSSARGVTKKSPRASQRPGRNGVERLAARDACTERGASPMRRYRLTLFGSFGGSAGVRGQGASLPGRLFS